jgi:Holliday junction resolvase-like predicted endonuclease
MSSTSGFDKIPEVRLWKIRKDSLFEINKSKLDFEDRLENWLASDISIIDPNFLVIGRQVITDFGGEIDLICIDEKGDIILLELKRDKTPREITAQVLDYASWAQHLSPERIQNIAESYLKNESFEEAYQNKFNVEFPESLNEEHRMLVVGSQIDSSSRRIISYLSETYGVPINAVTFNYFTEAENEYLAQTFLIEKDKTHIPLGSKRRPRLTFRQLQEIAEVMGVGEVYKFLFIELQKYFDNVGRTRSSVAFRGEFRSTRRASIFNLIPPDSDPEKGVRYQVYDLRFREYFNISVEQAQSIYPVNREPWKYGTPGDQKKYEEEDILDQWSGYTGYIEMSEAEKFIQKISEINQSKM